MPNGEATKRERKPVVGFGPRNVVFVRFRRIDEKGKTLEQVGAERRTMVNNALSFVSAMMRQGRTVALLGTNFARTWVEGVLQVSDRPGQLVHTFLTSDRGGRTVVAFVTNWPKGASYDDLADDIRDYEELSATAAQKQAHVSDLIADYNAKHAGK